MAFIRSEQYYPPEECDNASSLLVDQYELREVIEKQLARPSGSGEVKYRVSPGLHVIVGSGGHGKSATVSKWVGKLKRAADADRIDLGYFEVGDADTGTLGSQSAEAIIGSILLKEPLDSLVNRYNLDDVEREILLKKVDGDGIMRVNHPGAVFMIDSVRDAGKWEHLAADLGATTLIETVTTTESKMTGHQEGEGESQNEGKSHQTMHGKQVGESVGEQDSKTHTDAAGESTKAAGQSEHFHYDARRKQFDLDGKTVYPDSKSTNASSSDGVTKGTSHVKNTSESESEGDVVTTGVSRNKHRSDTASETVGKSISVREGMDRTAQPGGLARGFVDLLIAIDLAARRLGLYLIVVANPLLSDSPDLRASFSGVCAGLKNVSNPLNYRNEEVRASDRLRYYIERGVPESAISNRRSCIVTIQSNQDLQRILDIDNENQSSNVPDSDEFITTDDTLRG